MKIPKQNWQSLLDFLSIFDFFLLSIILHHAIIGSAIVGHASYVTMTACGRQLLEAI